ncbi:MAG: hypothetical protein KDG89_11285, partial [Geminicoccaceae bacterium]|nr:hypothetical protein [Geminicoccaceae bacterium]
MDAFLFDADEPDAPEGKPRLPSLASLPRYRRQVAREMEEAGGNLRGLIDGRPGRAGGTDEPQAWEEGADEGEAWDEDDAADLCTDEPEPDAAPRAALPGLVFSDPRTDLVGWCRAKRKEMEARFEAGERG